MKHYNEKESGLALDEPSLGGMIGGLVLGVIAYTIVIFAGALIIKFVISLFN